MAANTAPAWRGPLVLGEKETQRIGDLLEAALAHGEHPNFIHRTEAILQRAQHAKGGPGFALEVEFRVDHVRVHLGGRPEYPPW